MNPLRSAIVLLGLCAAVGAQVPATKPAAAEDSEIVRLKAESKMFQVTLEQRDKELAVLRDQLSALTAQLAGTPSAVAPMPSTAPATREAVVKRIVGGKLPDRPFIRMSVGQIGLIAGFTVISILGEDAMLIKGLPPEGSREELSPYFPTGQSFRPGQIDLPSPPPRAEVYTFVLEGISTAGLSEQQSVKKELPLKVVRSRTVEGKTYFVAWPVVKEGQVSQGRKQQ